MRLMRQCRGSYSFVAVGASAGEYDTLAEPVGQRLLFAGEHTCKARRAYERGGLLLLFFCHCVGL